VADDERFAYGETAEQRSVTETPEQLSVIEMEVNVASDMSRLRIRKSAAMFQETHWGTSFCTGKLLYEAEIGSTFG
jgi:hypothetical protein